VIGSGSPDTRRGAVEPLLAAGVALALAWDLADHGISVGEQVGRETRTRRNVAVHAGTNLLAGGLSVAVVYGVYLAAAGEPAGRRTARCSCSAVALAGRWRWRGAAVSAAVSIPADSSDRRNSPPIAGPFVPSPTLRYAHTEATATTAAIATAATAAARPDRGDRDASAATTATTAPVGWSA